MTTMTNKAYDIQQWAFSASDRILPDANFWINVFGPAVVVSRPRSRAPIYSQCFRNMLSQKVRLYLDVLVASEFVNTLARQEFAASYRTRYQNFKHFRNSQDFQPVAQFISHELGKIVRITNRLDHPFSQVDVDQILKDYGQGGEDFNDQLITGIAKDQGLKLLTDDGDMTIGGIEVLTANPRLLRACPH